MLDPEKTEVKFNSEWLAKLNFSEVLSLASKCTVARMMEREDFKNRFTNGQSIGIHEFFYPIMQAFDSIHLHADIELGGRDQIHRVRDLAGILNALDALFQQLTGRHDSRLPRRPSMRSGWCRSARE